MSKEYYLGLDIGTNSVGWAVTDENYNICKFKKKSLWGIRLFEGANTAAERRASRCNRRRLARRKQRIDLLQSIFAEEMSKVDDTFFIRLNESRLHTVDKSTNTKFPLFIDKEYTDIDYYKDYPTIFHLRKALIEGTAKADIRLLYLALHNIIKYRGHFLIDGDLSGAKSFRTTIDNLLEVLTNELELPFEILDDDKLAFEEILKDKKIQKSTKHKKLSELFYIDKNEYSEETCKLYKKAVGEAAKLIVGAKGDVVKLLGIDKELLEIPSFSFGDAKYDDNIRSQLDEKIPEKAYVIDCIKAIYDWAILADILQNEAYLSFAKVKQFEYHKKNLRQIRRLILKYYDKKIYNDFFNNQEVQESYSAYIGEVKKNGKKYAIGTKSGKSKKNSNGKVNIKSKEEIFYNKLYDMLDKITPDESDREVLESLISSVKLQETLPLQRSKDNGVIPHQVHEVELKKILEQSSKIFPFLLNKDDSGITISDKILSIFTYKIPYYVGPLSSRHREEGANNWMVRKSGNTDKIYPWNITQIVDYEASNEAFIRRMTNKCTYLTGLDVIPKNSLLYSKFMVLNELNNIKINGKNIPVSAKQSIYNDLFKKKARVTGKALLQYLKQEIGDLSIEDLSGFDKDFHTSLKSYLDFEKQVFGDDIENYDVQNMIEDIIKWITIYGDDKKMVRSMIENNYPNKCSEEQLKKIATLKYSGWGHFSRELLTQIEGVNNDTGETFSIIDALWETNDNLMQLFSPRYTFSEEIDTYNSDNEKEIGKVTYDSVVKNLFVSPATKRAIWQTVEISEEIKKIMGSEPKRIFIEMARGGEKKKEVQASRKERLKLLLENCEDDSRNWSEELEKWEERDFSSMKLFLYYTQMGRCMYTGEEIDIDALMSNNSKWDRDHIYPQSKIKDDSIDNIVLVNKTVNAKKTNEILSSDIQHKMKSFWSSLLDKGLISKKKYDRLTKTDGFSEDELVGFISRQLVETRQSSKAVADVFKRIYKDSNIVYVKAGLVSDFRKNTLYYLKSRRVNDYHHAKDAYLNIVVGNVYNAKFTSNPITWIKKNKDSNYSLNKVFYYDVCRGSKLVWKAPDRDDEKKIIKNTGTICDIRKTVRRNDILYTEPSYCAKGELFNATIKRKNSGAKIKLKSNLDTERYGGYYSPITSYFAFIEFDRKKGERVKQIIGVPYYISNMLDHKPNAFEEYCAEILKLKNVKVLMPRIKKNSLMVVNGFPMRIRSDNKEDIGFKGNLQLKVNAEVEEVIRKIEKYLEHKSQYELSENFDRISNQDIDNLFELFLVKMNSLYVNRPGNQYEKIVRNKTIFNELEYSAAKLKILDQMLTLLRCDIETKADLSKIGCASRAGYMVMNKNTLGKSKIILINQSCTGVFENRIEL